MWELPVVWKNSSTSSRTSLYFRLRSTCLLSGGFHLINTPESIKIRGCSPRNILDAPEMHCQTNSSRLLSKLVEAVWGTLTVEAVWTSWGQHQRWHRRWHRRWHQCAQSSQYIRENWQSFLAGMLTRCIPLSFLCRHVLAGGFFFQSTWNMAVPTPACRSSKATAGTACVCCDVVLQGEMGTWSRVWLLPLSYGRVVVCASEWDSCDEKRISF
jgi:hypothetical protein